MNTKRLVILIVVIIGIMLLSFLYNFFYINIKQGANEEYHVSKDFEKYFNIVIDNITKNSIIIEAIKNSNIQYQNISNAEILKLDQQWINAKKDNNFVTELLNNKCSQELRNIQQNFPEMIEIFVTNKFGLNVCATNKTSDFYQADEAWWQECYANGKGKIFHDSIQYDESALSTVIPIYVPVKIPENNEVIGIIKSNLFFEQFIYSLE